MTMTAYSSKMSYSYDKINLVLKEVSLDVAAGKCVGLVGPNGSGKTTFIRCLLGIFSPVVGSANILGYNPEKERGKIISQVGYLPEGAGIYPNLTLEQYIKLFASLRGAEDALDRGSKLLEMLDLKQVLRKKLASFSKGMKQKAKLAAVFIHAPRLLILDEPTDGLDMAAKEEIIAYIKKLKREGSSILLASHDPYVIECLCDEIGLLVEGKLAYKGKVSEFKESIQKRPSFEIRLKGLVEEEKIKEFVSEIPPFNYQLTDETLLELVDFSPEEAQDFNRKLVLEGFQVKSFKEIWPSFSKSYQEFLTRAELHLTG